MKLFQRTKDLCRNRRPFEELVGNGLVRDLCTEEIQSKSGPGSVARISDEELSGSRVSFGVRSGLLRILDTRTPDGIGDRQHRGQPGRRTDQEQRKAA